MSSHLSNLLLQDFVLFWTIARCGPPSFAESTTLTRFSQQTIVNRQTIKSLGYRVEALVESLCIPTFEGDVKEERRRKGLER